MLSRSLGMTTSQPSAETAPLLCSARKRCTLIESCLAEYWQYASAMECRKARWLRMSLVVALVYCFGRTDISRAVCTKLSKFPLAQVCVNAAILACQSSLFFIAD